MDTQLIRPLNTFSEWIRAEDAHAGYHLELLAQANRVLEAPQPASAGQRADLAERLERWRYQLLSERRGRLRPEDLQLAEALDLTAARLAGRPARPPRSLRRVLGDPEFGREVIQQAQMRLDPRFPLDRLVEEARRLTQAHFAAPAPNGTGGQRRRMFLYVPLYLSNYCINYCLYCGFRYPEQIPRRQLSLQEALREAEVLAQWGFRHVLLVAGDFPGRITTEYLTEVARRLHARGFQLAVEIAPLSTADYQALRAAGICGVTLYQETYREDLYYQYHPRGVKSAYDWRLEGLERAAEAGMGRLGLGILLGLAPPAEDLLAMLRHALYLRERFPDRILAFSLPRIHDAPSGFRIPFPVSDEQLIRLYCVLRVAFPEAELVLSTREPPWLRNHLARICITQMSAGSSTAPGGYREKSLSWRRPHAAPGPASSAESCRPPLGLPTPPPTPLSEPAHVPPANALQTWALPAGTPPVSPPPACAPPASTAPAPTPEACAPPAWGGSAWAESAQTAFPLHRRPGEQFPVADHRSPAELSDWLRSEGFLIVWQGVEPAPCPE